MTLGASSSKACTSSIGTSMRWAIASTISWSKTFQSSRVPTSRAIVPPLPRPLG